MSISWGIGAILLGIALLVVVVVSFVLGYVSGFAHGAAKAILSEPDEDDPAATDGAGFDTCPECGSPTPGGGLCKDCRDDESN